MRNRNRGNHILELTERPSPIKEGVPSYRKEPLLASKKRPLYLQTIVFTPLSIRRGDGGEAVDGMVEGCRWVGERLFFRPYLPIQKCLKIFPNTSFGVICPPVISASSSRQMRRSSLIRSPERLIERASITRRIDSSARVSAS